MTNEEYIINEKVWIKKHNLKIGGHVKVTRRAKKGDTIKIIGLSKEAHKKEYDYLTYKKYIETYESYFNLVGVISGRTQISKDSKKVYYVKFKGNKMIDFYSNEMKLYSPLKDKLSLLKNLTQ